MSEHKADSSKAFKKSDYLSYKHRNYFPIYDEVFGEYRDKDNITLVEVFQ